MTGAPELGEAVHFLPSAFTDYDPGVAQKWLAVGKVTGRVVYVHEAHRLYRVRVELPDGSVLHECFKF